MSAPTPDARPTAPATSAGTYPATSPPAAAPDKLVFIDAATQIDNLGDDIILRQLLRILERRARVVVDVSNVPGWAREVIAVDPETAFDRKGFTRALLLAGARRLRSRSAPRVFLVLKPGHIGGHYGFVRSLGRIGLLALTGLCRVLGVRVIRAAFSVDDCQGALLRIERAQSRLQHVYAPRDGVSERYAAREGIRTTGRSTDLAYTLRVTDEPAIERRGTVLSFAASTDGHLQPDYADELERFLHRYVDAGPATEMTWCAQVVRDAQFGDRVLTGRPQVSRLSFDRDAATAEKIFDQYSTADLVLTNRLHSFLFALSRGALAVVVTDPDRHGKIVGIIDEMGLGELLVPLAGLTPQLLALRIAALRADKVRILSVVSSFFDEQADRLDALFDEWVGIGVR